MNENSSDWTVLKPVTPAVLQRIMLYRTKSHFYLLGYNGEESACRMMEISRVDKYKLKVNENSILYSKEDSKELLQDIHESNISDGGLHFVTEAFGILGCVRFLEGYYLLLITKRKKIGLIGGHEVYGVAETNLIALSGASESASEKRYVKLLISGIDLTKDFFFSYTYNLCYNVQYNLTNSDPEDPFNCMYVWNQYLTQDLRIATGNNEWVLPLIHGSFLQRNLSMLGRIITLTLISRRSCRFAGTRYLKRGINRKGWVANEVETEQIVSLEQDYKTPVPYMSTIVQLRGSIPLFWSQSTAALNPRPNITLYNMDPLYESTEKHFKELIERYQNPVIVLNLVKSYEKQPRETILRSEFGKAINHLNQHVFNNDLVYIPWDFKNHMRRDEHSFLQQMVPMVTKCLTTTGICVVAPSSDNRSKRDIESLQPILQQGIIRTNCIDCIDRTNISQYVCGLVALGYQLNALGVTVTHEIDYESSLAHQLMAMYERMGNELALQYGGSEAHGKFFDKMKGHSTAATNSKEVVTSIKRYYNNAVTDSEKQDAINLFLGHYQPKPGYPALWELDSDHFLHSGIDIMDSCRFFKEDNLKISLSTTSALAPENSPFLLSRKRDQPSVEFFPLPTVSQVGDPESTAPLPLSIRSSIKDKKEQNTWHLMSLFRSNRDHKLKFIHPEETSSSNFISLHEIINDHHISEVRLQDYYHCMSPRFKNSHLSKNDYYPSIIEMSQPPKREDSVKAYMKQREKLERYESLKEKAREGLRSLERKSKHLVQPDRSLPSKLNLHSILSSSSISSSSLRCNSLEHTSTSSISAPENTLIHVDSNEKSLIEERQRNNVVSTTEFGTNTDLTLSYSFTSKSGSKHNKKTSNSKNEISPFQYFRDHSTSTADFKEVVEVEEIKSKEGGEEIYDKLSTAMNDPVEQMWTEYWSITPESLTRELIISEEEDNSIWNDLFMFGIEEEVATAADDEALAVVTENAFAGHSGLDDMQAGFHNSFKSITNATLTDDDYIDKDGDDNSWDLYNLLLKDFSNAQVDNSGINNNNDNKGLSDVDFILDGILNESCNFNIEENEFDCHHLISKESINSTTLVNNNNNNNNRENLAPNVKKGNTSQMTAMNEASKLEDVSSLISNGRKQFPNNKIKMTSYQSDYGYTNLNMLLFSEPKGYLDNVFGKWFASDSLLDDKELYKKYMDIGATRNHHKHQTVTFSLSKVC